MLKKSFSGRLFIIILTVVILAASGLSLFKYYNRPVSEPESSAEITHIKFYYTSPENSESDRSFKGIINDYNSSQNNISVEGYSGVNVEKQLVSIMSGNTHDVSYNLWPTAIRWAQNGLLEPLSPYIKESNFDIEDFLPTTLDMGKYDEVIYSIPFYVQTMTLYYNVDMLKEIGLDEPPQTFSEFMEVSKRLTIIDENGDIQRMGFLPDYPWIDNVLWPILFGAEFYDPEKNEVTTTSPEYIEAIEFQNWFYKEFGWDKISKFKLSFGTGGQEPFYDNKLAMVMGGDWVTLRAKKYKPDMKYGISPFPYPDDRPYLKNTSMISTSVVGIPASSQHKEEAWRFLEYLVSKKSMLKYAVENLSPMARKSVITNPKIRNNPDLELLTSFALNNNIRGFTPLPIVDEYLGSLTEQTELVFKQRKNAYEAMKAVKQEIDPLLKK